MPITINDLPDELRKALQPDTAEPASSRRKGISAEQVHSAAIDALYTLRALTKPDKRRALQKALKILDA